MAKRKKSTKPCSFCNTSYEDLSLLIKGNRGYICQRCVDYCLEIITLQEQRDDRGGVPLIKRPSEIKAALDEQVIGQERAKKF